MSKDHKQEYQNIFVNIAMHGWFDERNITQEKKKEIIYSNCCKYGQIKIPPFKEPPEFLSRLINNKHEPISKHFLPKIRQYNSLFAFTSMGGNIDKKN